MKTHEAPSSHNIDIRRAAKAFSAATLLGLAACSSHATGELTVVSPIAFVTHDMGWPHLNFCGVPSAADETPQTYTPNDSPSQYPYLRLTQGTNGLTVHDSVEKPFAEVGGSSQSAVLTRSATAGMNWTQGTRETVIDGQAVSLACAAGYQTIDTDPKPTDDRLYNFPVANDTREVQDLPDGTVVKVTFDDATPYKHGLEQLGTIDPSQIDSHIQTITVQ